MAVSKELLEYQKVDAELRKIEQEISQSDERKKYVQAKKFMETAAEKLEAMDARACELKEMAIRLTFNYQELNKAILEYAEIDEMVEAGETSPSIKRRCRRSPISCVRSKTSLQSSSPRSRTPARSTAA